MSYSGRVNSKKGSGGLADRSEAGVYLKQRVKELLANDVLNLDADPYVYKNHLGILECKICLTTHVNEASYISHLCGKKHQINLSKRKDLDQKFNKQQTTPKFDNLVSITNTPKRKWIKIGKPAYKIIKLRDPDTDQLGVLICVKLPKISVEEPFFRFMSNFELTVKNKSLYNSFIKKNISSYGRSDLSNFQCLVISAEPYENICFLIPDKKEIEKSTNSDNASNNYWSHWDSDVKDFYLQFFYKN